MKANRLIDEKSPYLLQHARNPVEWHAWHDEAFARAAAENKPIFLSIGYATCHWCHVMEKESFEDEEAARFLNDTFVCIKVDREERPDIDAVYMAACHMLNGSGGWPLTIFMTPDKKPFFRTLDRQPSAFTFFLCGLDFALRPGQDIVIAGESGSPDAERLVATLNRRFAPNLVAQLKSGGNAARLARCGIMVMDSPTDVLPSVLRWLGRDPNGSSAEDYRAAEQAIAVTTAAKNTVRIQRVLSEDGTELRLYCHSDQREDKETAITQRFSERFERGLAKLAAALQTQRGDKRRDKIQQRLGRLHGAGRNRSARWPRRR